MSLVLKTKRIYLKKFTSKDITNVYELDGDSDVMKYITLGKARTVKQVQEKVFPRILSSYSINNKYGIFAAYLIDSDDFIGWFQFEKDKELKNAVEIGWRLKKEYWSNGYASEVAIELVNLCMSSKKIAVARAMIDNIASIRVMEKSGLKFKKEFWGDYEPHSGTSDVLYIKEPLL